MKIITTPRELMDRWVWDDACEMLDINIWAVNEGQMESDEQITLTVEQAQELGLFPKQKPWTTLSHGDWPAWKADADDF